MSTPPLDPRLQQDCHSLGTIGHSQLLLMDNSLLPWFIIVPDTLLTTFTDLPLPAQHATLDEINALSDFIQSHYPVERMNIATIGNVVKQLHIHVVGRHSNDYCWPGVVWGTTERVAYDAETVSGVCERLDASLGSLFKAYEI